MLLQPIADRLKDPALGLGFVKVAGAADFANARRDAVRTPSAYVIPRGDLPKPNELLGNSVSQLVVERFAVILAVNNARDQRGDAVNASLEAIRDPTLKALLNFVPATGYNPITYAGGKMLMLDVSVMWWQLEFLTGIYETSL